MYKFNWKFKGEQKGGGAVAKDKGIRVHVQFFNQQHKKPSKSSSETVDQWSQFLNENYFTRGKPCIQCTSIPIISLFKKR